MLVTLSEPKLVKKLIVSLILRKANIAMTEKRIDKMMEIMRRVLEFLKKTKKALRTVRKMTIIITMMRYLVGRMSRRKTLIRSIRREIVAMQARILAARFNLLLVGLCSVGMILFFAIVDDSLAGSSVAIVSSVVSSIIDSVEIGFSMDAFGMLDSSMLGFLDDFWGVTEGLMGFLVFFFFTRSIVLLIILL